MRLYKNYQVFDQLNSLFWNRKIYFLTFTLDTILFHPWRISTLLLIINPDRLLSLLVTLIPNMLFFRIKKDKKKTDVGHSPTYVQKQRKAWQFWGKFCINCSDNMSWFWLVFVCFLCLLVGWFLVHFVLFCFVFNTYS